MTAEKDIMNKIGAVITDAAPIFTNLTLTIGVIRGDETYIRSFGDAVADAAHALYEIGSITKVFTSALLAAAIEQGVVRLDDTLAKLVPELSDNSSVAHITLVQLATHTSGLPSLPVDIERTMTDTRNPFQHYSDADLIHYLQGYDGKLSSEYEYSNVGYALLGLVLSRHMHAPYEEIVSTQLCSRLQLRDTVFHPNDEQRARMLPVFTAQKEPTVPFAFDVFSAAGSLRSTASDMLTWVRANIDTPHTMAAQYFQTAQSARVRLDDQLSVGLGWMRSGSADRPIIWHNGGTYGSSSFAGFIKELQTGVVVLANNGISDEGAISDAIGLSLLTDLMDL